MYYGICRNASGYMDPTAAVALLRIIQEDKVRREAENKAKNGCHLVQRKSSGVSYVGGTRLAW